MAVTCGFFNAIEMDRVYNAEQMGAMFDGVITDGVFAGVGDKLMIRPVNGMVVTVGTGRAWFDSTWTKNDAPLPLNVPVADIYLARKDAIVLEVNKTEPIRNNNIFVKAGTPSASPLPPDMTRDDQVTQYALGYVTIPAGTTVITAAMIDQNVGKSDCPFVTSVLQQTDIDLLFAAWDKEFNDWLDNVQAQLTGNVVTNLQRQIDQKVNTADKATTAEAQAGTDDDNWMTPLKTRQAMLSSPEVTGSIGDIKQATYNLETADSRFIRMDGRELSRSAYPELWNKLKGKYGTPAEGATVKGGITMSGPLQNRACATATNGASCFVIGDSRSSRATGLILLVGSNKAVQYSYNQDFPTDFYPISAFYIGTQPYVVYALRTGTGGSATDQVYVATVGTSSCVSIGTFGSGAIWIDGIVIVGSTAYIAYSRIPNGANYSTLPNIIRTRTGELGIMQVSGSSANILWSTNDTTDGPRYILGGTYYYGSNQSIITAFSTRPITDSALLSYRADWIAEKKIGNASATALQFYSPQFAAGNAGATVLAYMIFDLGGRARRKAAIIRLTGTSTITYKKLDVYDVAPSRVLSSGIGVYTDQEYGTAGIADIIINSAGQLIAVEGVVLRVDGMQIRALTSNGCVLGYETDDGFIFQGVVNFDPEPVAIQGSYANMGMYKILNPMSYFVICAAQWDQDQPQDNPGVCFVTPSTSTYYAPFLRGKESIGSDVALPANPLQDITFVKVK